MIRSSRVLRLLLGLLLGPVSAAAHAGPLGTSAGSWILALGPPARGLDEAAADRSAEDPLMLFWMSVQADPMGAGVPMRGTLVANFQANGESPETYGIADFTFLAVADAAAVDQWEQDVQTRALSHTGPAPSADRPGWTQRSLGLTDGTTVQYGRSTEPGRGAMADGRPAPTLWIHASALPSSQ